MVRLRPWPIGETRPVKVYFFAYEETIQEDALRLVAAKVAAALRVNGDTFNTDSLAELGDLTSGDLVTTLAKIVTGRCRLRRAACSRLLPPPMPACARRVR